MLNGCRRDEEHFLGDTHQVGTPLEVAVPANFPPMPVPADNPFTVEGVALGRFLFYEELLSGDNTMSCASCHSPEVAFTDDGNQFSTDRWHTRHAQCDGVDQPGMGYALFLMVVC